MTIDISTLYREDGTAKLAKLPCYQQQVLDSVVDAADVVLTGPGPVWLYLSVSHLLHGRVRSLTYDSPVTGQVLIYDHNPY